MRTEPDIALTIVDNEGNVLFTAEPGTSFELVFRKDGKMKKIVATNPNALLHSYERIQASDLYTG